MHPIPYWRLSGFYFFYFSTLGSFLPYWGLYLQSLGFSPRQIGTLMALLAGTKIIAPNMVGWIGDRRGRSMGLIRIASFAAVIAFMGVFVDSGYRWLLLVTVVFSFFWNAALPQFEAVTFSHLKGRTHHYSLIRIWGSIGFIATVMGVGVLLDYHDIALLPVMISALMATIWLITHTVPESTAAEHSKAGSSLQQIIKRPDVLALLATVFLVQAAHGPYYVFFSIDLENHGYTGTQIGLLWSLGVVAEVLLFLVMHRILKRFTLRHILLVSVFLSIVRWLLIGWGIDYLTALVAAQVLHAATFGATHVAAIQLIHRAFYGVHQGKGQALYSSVGFGLGGMIGSYYSGAFWEARGPVVVFTSAAGLSVLAFLIVWRWVGRDSAVRRRTRF